MPRLTIAQRTIQKQIDRILLDIAEHTREIDLHSAIRHELNNQISVLMHELSQARTSLPATKKAPHP